MKAHTQPYALNTETFPIPLAIPCPVASPENCDEHRSEPGWLPLTGAPFSWLVGRCCEFLSFGKGPTYAPFQLSGVCLPNLVTVRPEHTHTGTHTQAHRHVRAHTHTHTHTHTHAHTHTLCTVFYFVLSFSFKLLILYWGIAD